MPYSDNNCLRSYSKEGSVIACRQREKGRNKRIPLKQGTENSGETKI